MTMNESTYLPETLNQSLVISMDKNGKYVVTIGPGELDLESYRSGLSQLIHSRPDLLAPFKNTDKIPHKLMESVRELSSWGESRGLEVEVQRKSKNMFSNNVSKAIYSLTGKMI